MCGIFAEWRAAGRVCRRAASRALGTLADRGPDDEGLWIGPRENVLLGHRRLQIIGKRNARQPLSNEDGTLQCVVNGEFYGFEALRRRLTAGGHRFRSDTDSEILLHLYEEQGLDCLRALRGEFAWVLWDARQQRLLAARDRFGVKPLVYCQADDRLLLASAARALFAAGVPPAWDEDAFFHVSSLQYEPPSRTLFEGVQQLPPGHLLECSARGVRTWPYWDLELPPQELPDAAAPHCASAEGHSIQEAVNECRAQLTEAVQVRLRSDAPVCFHLSGGLDSTTVLALGARLSGKPPTAFCVGFDVDGYDETAHAERTARELGAELHVVRLSAEMLSDHLEAAVVASEGLAINGHLPAKYLLHRAIRRAGFRVVLSGEGADEAFAGYGHLRIDAARQAESKGDRDEQVGNARVAQVWKQDITSRGMMLPVGGGLSLAALRRRLGFAPAFLEAKASLGLRMRRLLRRDFLARHADRDPFLELVRSPDAARQLDGRDAVRRSTWLWCKTALTNYILKTLGDGTEMPWGVEGRPPFLDHHLHEWLRGIRLDHLIRGPCEKFLLREAARAWIPADVQRRRKHPFDAPPQSLFPRPHGGEALLDAMHSRALHEQPFFSPRRVGDLLRRLPNLPPQERQAWDPALMMVRSTLALANGLLKIPLDDKNVSLSFSLS